MARDPLAIRDASITFKQGGRRTDAVKRMSFTLDRGPTLARPKETSCAMSSLHAKGSGDVLRCMPKEETMNRIVRENYPVSKLPDDLRDGILNSDQVRVTIEFLVPEAVAEDEAPHARGSFSARYGRFRRVNFGSAEDVVAYVRSLRDD